MKFRADEIASVIRQEIEQFESRVDVREVGRVLEVGDGIARVYGLVQRHGRKRWSSSRAKCSGWPSTWKRTRWA